MSRSSVTWALAVIGSCWLACQPNETSAQTAPDDATRAAARQLGEQGIHAYEANDFVSADANLDHAYRLFHVPTLGLWSARARQQLGRWVEAAERYRDTMRLSEPAADSAAQKSAQRDAASELEALLARIPSLTIQVEASDARPVSVTLDGVDVPADMLGVARPTNPGTHRLVAKRGDERLQATVELVEKDAKVVPFAWPSQPAPLVASAPTVASPPPPTAASAVREPSGEPAMSGLRIASIALVAAGGVGLATWGISALVAHGKLERCPNDVCESDSAKASYDSAKTVSTVSFYVGAAFAVAGVATWFIAPATEKPSQPALSWGVAPNGVALRGTF